MCDFRIHGFQDFDQWKDSNSIGNHIQWVPLHQALPNMENIGHPIPVSQDNQGMMTISVKKNELQTAINGNRPQQSNSINLIKGVLCANKLKTSVPLVELASQIY